MLSLKNTFYAYHALREVAFLKYRTSTIIVTTLITLAAIGIIGNLIEDPLQVLINIAAFLIIGFVVYLIVRRLLMNRAVPKNREQQAFRKAAKKSQKRFNRKEPSKKMYTNSSLSTKKPKKVKSKSASHLTVIEGKKGKKKNRASF